MRGGGCCARSTSSSIDGVTTLLGFHQALLSHPCFVEGATCHGLVESELLAAARERVRRTDVRVGRPSDGSRCRARPSGRSRSTAAASSVTCSPRAALRRARAAPARARARRRSTAPGREAVVSPMQGTVLAVEVAEGDEVAAGQVICIVEAMKMENEIHAHRAGRVTRLSVAAGQPVTTGQVICVVEA